MVISISNILRIYDIEKNKIIQDIDVHENEINDLLKINNNIFISSSKDKTIKFIKLIDNYSKYIIIKNLEIHSKEVNQTIKLKENNFFASCSNDRTIKIWKLEINDNENLNDNNNYSLE